MPFYQFYFYDAKGGRPVLDFADCADDHDAGHAAARQLSQHPSCVGVDVFFGERLVIRLERCGDEVISMQDDALN